MVSSHQVYPFRKFSQILFGSLKIVLLSLYQFFTTLLIKKGGGLWPDDTLATCYRLRFETRCQIHPDASRER
jgi:hypothetical protein